MVDHRKLKVLFQSHVLHFNPVITTFHISDLYCCSAGLPPLVSRRVLEILTYLATNHLPVANILFFFDPSWDLESQSTQFENKEHYERKTPENFGVLNVLETSQKVYIPLVLFLKLLNRPLFLRSNAHLEQVFLSHKFEYFLRNMYDYLTSTYFRRS